MRKYISPLYLENCAKFVDYSDYTDNNCAQPLRDQSLGNQELLTVDCEGLASVKKTPREHIHSRCSRTSRWMALGLWVVLVLSALPAAAQSEPVVKIYACPTGQAATIADRLRNEFGVFQNVRIASDERTSQVIVQAPAEIQARVPQRINTLSTLPAAAPIRPADAPRTTASYQVRRVRLNYTKPASMASALTNIFGSRLVHLPSQQVQTWRYRLVLTGGGSFDLTFDLANPQVTIEGPGAAIDRCMYLIQVLDAPRQADGSEIRLLPLQTGKTASIRKVSEAIRNGAAPRQTTPFMEARLYQRNETAQTTQPSTNPPSASAVNPPSATPAHPAPDQRRPGALGPVQIEILDGLDVIVLRGNAQDINQVSGIINQIERMSAETEPEVNIIPVHQVDCQALADLLLSLYEEVYQPRQGRVSITPLVKPNALLVVGRPENITTVKSLVERLDQPVNPNTQFQVFHLRHASAGVVQTLLQQFFEDRGALGTFARVISDARSNALIVQASPRDMEEIIAMVKRLDTATSDSVNEVRIIQLEHALAQDVAAILQAAIGAATGQSTQPGAARQPNVPGQLNQAAAGQQNEQRTAMLRFLTVDAKGRRLLSSGILTDVTVTADTRANALIVSAPRDNLELIEALVRQLDQLPAAEALIKVFTIVNGDASNLSSMLQSLFAAQLTQTGQQGMAQAPQTSTAGAGTSLVPLRLGVDTRTNSIIACGSAADLTVIEALLTRLDDGVRNRKSVVMRLKNSPVVQVAETINTFLSNERNIEQIAPGMTSAYEQVQREVVVVPEQVSNSLVLSATPRYFNEIKRIIEQLDARPPMVMIQVLIAQIDLGNTNEFGIELGLQDSVLFDRSVLSNLQTTSTTLPNGTTTETIASADLNPGFNFNNGNPLGNSGGSSANPNVIGGQGLSNFALGRQNSTLGYGGLVLSLASENVSMLLRALSENHRVEVLQRPQIMTLDNQPAFIQVGQRVPRITGTTVNANGAVNTITLENVGLILGVTPRISPDGLVVMQIDAEKSAIESEATGIPITSTNGQIIRSPIIDSTTAQTTVSAMSGQTVVLGGLIARSANDYHRKVPLMGDLPLLGHLFRFDGKAISRTELLIIMTPHIVKNENDADNIRRTEAARMSWCLQDVTKMYGDLGLRSRTDQWLDEETMVIYPDLQSHSQPNVLPERGKSPEQVPTPAGAPRANGGNLPSFPQVPAGRQLPQNVSPAPIREHGPQQTSPSSYAPTWNGVQPANYQETAPQDYMRR